MSEIRFFEFDGNFYVAYAMDSCIEFICKQESSCSYEEVCQNIIQVPPDTVISKFVCEDFTFNGMHGTAEFYDATISQLYESLYKDSILGIPCQITFDAS